MPEIAEVRWLVENLSANILGCKVGRIMVAHKNLFQDHQDKTLTQEQVNDVFGPPNTNTICSISRRGKFILFHFTNNLTMASHLGFTGWWIPDWAKEQSPRRFLHPMDINRHTRVTIQTDKGPIYLIDPRCLSRHRIFTTQEQCLNSRHLCRMGPDADSDLGQLVLKTALPKTGRRIRDVIMDQQIASGVGNYLACESLHRARLHGSEPAKKLTDNQVSLLLSSIRECIQLAESQDNTNWWCVFQRKTCACGAKVIREAWGKRGHYRCTVCQKPPLVR